MCIIKIFTLIFVIYCCSYIQKTTADANEDCETLKVRCGYCARSLHAGPDEDNMMGRINRKCRQKVGLRFVWQDLLRCDIVYIRCKGMNENLSCIKIAELANMRRRLQ